MRGRLTIALARQVGGLILGLLLLTTPAMAQTRVTVHVAHAGTDAAGQTFAYALREEIRRSTGYTYATQEVEALFTLHLSSGSIEEAGLGGRTLGSAVSIAITMMNILPLDTTEPQTWLPIFLTSRAAIVAATPDTVAAQTMGWLDSTVQEYFKLLVKQQPAAEPARSRPTLSEAI
jgi:hypothetical protein